VQTLLDLIEAPADGFDLIEQQERRIVGAPGVAAVAGQPTAGVAAAGLGTSP
jgi:hypothetical protein